MKRVGNFSVAISLEGFDEVNDLRRGKGVFDKVMHAMDLMKQYGLIFGTSICYTSKNYKVVTSDEFLDMIIEKGARFSWYFHYMPVGNDASTELLLDPDQREYMYHRIREIRAMKGGKPIFAFDFQNDGEYVGGCIAGGRNYCQNPEILQRMVHETGAHSTDLQSPESVEHLCGKCAEYAKNWDERAQELWNK